MGQERDVTRYRDVICQLTTAAGIMTAQHLFETLELLNETFPFFFA
jgi:hypothetical protein